MLSSTTTTTTHPLPTPPQLLYFFPLFHKQPLFKNTTQQTTINSNCFSPPSIAVEKEQIAGRVGVA